ncbi:MAG: ABC transporter ATP-binding protein [Dehalococcoidia bacterium]|jgi:branched-chain amino acid transport system ATP-binding protein
MLLSVRDLFVNYGELEVLKGVSLDIPEGEISLLLGANGSGKSTLLKTISGLNHPVSGSIWFEDKRIDGMPPHKIVKLGITQTLEGRFVFAPMSVYDNLKLGAYARKDKRQVAEDMKTLFERFPVLRKKLKEKSGNLSGGEQQVLGTARALMTKPKLLLMDEPSQGLAPSVVSDVADIVTGINQSGITIIIVEHNLRLGLSIAHNVFVLENGKIAFVTKSTDLTQVDYAKKIYLGG